MLRLSRGFHQFVCLSVTRILVGVILALMLRGGAIAGPLEDARTAYKRGDFATALQIWRPRATQGVAFAQVNVGIMYYSGQGVPQDYGEAAKWYRLAAEQGDAIAQGNLGFMYYSGQGVPQGLWRSREVVSPRRRARKRHSPEQSRQHVLQWPGRPTELRSGVHVGRSRCLTVSTLGERGPG